MSIKRFSARRDVNEREIVQVLRAMGCKVMALEKFDLLVQRGNSLYLLEVKTQRGRLTRLQKLLIEDGWRVHVVREPVEALRAVGL